MYKEWLKIPSIRKSWLDEYSYMENRSDHSVTLEGQLVNIVEIFECLVWVVWENRETLIKYVGDVARWSDEK